MTKIFYDGPGNMWKVAIAKSVVTGKATQISGVKSRTALTFFNTHTVKTGWYKILPEFKASGVPDPL